MDIFQSFTSEEVGVWGFVSTLIALGLFAVMFICIRAYLSEKAKKKEFSTIDEMKEYVRACALVPYKITQKVVEVVIANTCIIGVMYVYMGLVKLCQNELFVELADWLGIMLLALIVIGIFVNNQIDRKFEQDLIDLEEKSILRLLSSVSILVPFFIAGIVYGTKEYNQILLTYLGLVLGRFIYFDTSKEQLKVDGKKYIKHVIYPIIVIALTSLYYWYGVELGALNKKSFMESVLMCHVSLLIVINVAKKIIKDLI